MKVRLSSLLSPRSLAPRKTTKPSFPRPPANHSFSTTPPNPSTPPPTSNSRWLSTTKSRLGKCILFGLSRPQCHQTAQILKILSHEWRDLVAGREGFLVSPAHAGLLRHPVVWGEMDSMGHVNNVMYVRYAESARVNWAAKYAVRDREFCEEWRELATPRGVGMILKSIGVEYKFPMTYPDHISVFHKLRALPSKDTSSFVLDVLILSELHQRPAARCVEDIVVYDYRAGKKVAVRPFMMKAFEETWRDQEEERKRVESRIQEVERAVAELERETWNREGAVEDLGSGT
ncbi:Thioesterase/thiol ester dehydrase-isomerase [Hyaloscypha variabilis]